MSNRFLCGRLITQKDGSLKRLVLADGGGARDCPISHIDMGFEEIHDHIKEIFGLTGSNCRSKLYDFQCKELDTNRYTTFFDYIQKNGLRFKGILLYLWTPAEGGDPVITPSPEKRKTIQPIPKPSPVIRIPQVEADSSTPAIAIKPDADIIPIDKLSVDNHRPKNVQRSSFSSYSFENSLNEFINHLRNLITRYKDENILVQLFEHICTIRGLSSIVLDRLKRHISSATNEHQNAVYNDGLDKVERISRSINALIELNKMKIAHIDSHSIIINSFNEFYQHFDTLRDRWVNNRSTPKQRTSSSSTNHSVDPTPTTSSSSRHHSESSSRKRTRTLSRSPYRSQRKSTNDDNNQDERYSLFKSLLRSLDDLIDVLHQRSLKSFFYLVESLISKIKVCRSNINLSDPRSLYEAEQFIVSIETRLTNRINDEYHHASPHGIHSQLEHTFDKTLDSLRHLLDSLHHYQSNLDKHKRSRTTHRSSPVEEKPMQNKSTQPKPDDDDDDDDDQSSDASHSSVGDEVLMEVARDAYEHRPKRLK